ncbi:uncharacterized protein EI90DRAFT_1316527 [Cantharellus anzutake]|uniref:uncharacterized protein n=1 Tax=Cantharellus anzutake TaxID=1750568 RepID=UPI001908CDF1|nr:uncharacterized protein EI90DRAFT_1316527 [Cantharellus anzutake]KAF8342220.1 hypothetical protein EI90DRAFT_1316527 [Cantharellus anzutake]
MSVTFVSGVCSSKLTSTQLISRLLPVLFVREYSLSRNIVRTWREANQAGETTRPVLEITESPAPQNGASSAVHASEDVEHC